MRVPFYIDLTTTIIFTFEIASKSIGYGLCFIDKNSYLRSKANILDFIIVVSSIFSMSTYVQEVTKINFGVLKVFRIARIMRPLRIVSRSEQLKITLSSLIKSIPQIINTIIFCVLFYFLFGIVGIN